MKTSFYIKTFLKIALLAALGLSACAKKDDSGDGREAVRGNTGDGVVTTQNTCPTGTQPEGKIFDAQASYGNKFEQQVKAFVSATLAPNLLGSISGNINDKTGVDFLASFTFDTAGKLALDSASVTIKIFDSLTSQTYNGKKIEPYIVDFSKAKSGYLNRATGEMKVIFEDAYGSITFNGRLNGQFVEGKIYFDNYVAVSGTPQAGELGDFRIYQCSMIK